MIHYWSSKEKTITCVCVCVCPLIIPSYLYYYLQEVNILIKMVISSSIFHGPNIRMFCFFFIVGCRRNFSEFKQSLVIFCKKTVTQKKKRKLELKFFGFFFLEIWIVFEKKQPRNREDGRWTAKENFTERKMNSKLSLKKTKDEILNLQKKKSPLVWNRTE